MITIRSSKNIFEPTLIGFGATLTTSRGDYEFSSPDPIVDPTSSFDDGLFGGLASPRSRFQDRSNLTLAAKSCQPRPLSTNGSHRNRGTTATLGDR